MKTKCKNCGGDSDEKKFCCERCKWTWHNHNRTLTPNLDYKCKECGKRVVKWVAPSRLKKGIDKAEYCSRQCAGRGRTGKKNHKWNGGRFQDKDGYWLVLVPDHPRANANGHVREHRLVMEKKIGRYLKSCEVVHHINDDPSDNRIENLKLYKNNAAHKAEDSARRVRDKSGRLTKRQ